MTRLQELITKGIKNLSEVEITEMETLIAANDVTSKKGKEALDENKKLQEQVAENVELKKKLDMKDNELFEITINTRKDELSSWLSGKSNMDNILKQIGEMDESTFTLFKDGKTNDVFKTKAQLELDAKALIDEKTTFESAKEKIISDAAKKITKGNGDDALIPTSELNIDEDGDDDRLEGALASIEETKKLYNLDGSSLYHNVIGFEKRATGYLENYNKFDK